MGRKREKGKARKAKAAATQQAPFNAGESVRQAMVGSESQVWRKWAMVGLTRGCTHGCPALPAPDHAVSLFMDALWANSNDKTSYDLFMSNTVVNHRQVWGDDATLRKLALDIMVVIGTNFILDTDDHGIKHAEVLAIKMSGVEHYNGNGNGGFKLAISKASLVADDLRCGGEREVIRFYLKRISCTCLKAKYSLIKKSQPTRMSGCSICKQVTVRSSMMLCGRCKAAQYCCRECQAANWPSHKGICTIIHEQMKK